jgi:phosphate/sulfate permease
MLLNLNTNCLLIAVTVANAVGPWVASYNTYVSGEVTSKADTPIWILVIAGLLLGIGFWGMYNHHTAEHSD